MYRFNVVDVMGGRMFALVTRDNVANPNSNDGHTFESKGSENRITHLQVARLSVITVGLILWDVVIVVEWESTGRKEGNFGGHPWFLLPNDKALPLLLLLLFVCHSVLHSTLYQRNCA